jgi:FtsH-binding integral membrane protein
MQPDRFEAQSVSRAGASVIDAGLRAHFQRVYNTMALGLGVTGIVAYAVANVPALMNLIFGTPLMWVAMFAPLAFVWFGFSPKAIQRKSTTQLNAMFYLFSAVFGICLATIFVAYAKADIARVFFITAAMFAGTSIFGYTTKRDLSGMGGLLIMGVIGLLIAIIVNLFLQSSMMHFVISVLGVVIYTGLTAWDTQNIKESYHPAAGAEANGKMAVMGALSLYINFIMLFQFLLNLLGNRE